MKELIWTVFVILPALTVQECLQPKHRPKVNKKLLTYFSRSEVQFSLNMAKDLYEREPTENLFFSPYSIYNTLLLAYFIANGETSTSLKNFLGFQENDKTETLWVYISNRKTGKKKRNKCPDCVEFALVNQFFLSSTEQAKRCMAKHFAEELKTIDFTTSPEAEINKVISNRTKGEIKNFLAEGSIDPDSKLVLANAAYFKGTWKSIFQVEDTTDEFFNTSKTTAVRVKMMVQESKFKYANSSRLAGNRIVELPYLESPFSMFILLPFEGTYNLSGLFSELSYETLIEVIERDTVLKTVNLKLPKFNIDYQIKLGTVLKRMNVGDLFDITSDLSGLTGKPDIHFSNAVHKSKIKVDEEGTTAAAATTFFSLRSIPPRIDNFHCNRPFLYFIYNRDSKKIIFIGTYMKPSEGK